MKKLDGVTSAIGIKEYLKKYGIKTVGANKIQYGGQEFAIPKPTDKTLNVLVDFAHGKPIMHIHTDHHESQIGYTKKQSTSFSKSPSNVAFISQILSPSDIFPSEDANFISMVDSAGYAKAGYGVEDIVQAIFSIDKEKDLKRNKDNLGFVVNKLVLAFKNKEGFLEQLVMRANPSLISMYVVTKQLMGEMNLDSPSSIQKRGIEYKMAQKGKVKKSTDVNDILKLKNGDQIIISGVVAQYGGGKMKTGSYDRFTVFKNNPAVNYLCIGWSMGMVQTSKNPFKVGKNPFNLGELIWNSIMPKYETMMKKKKASLKYIKFINEADVKKDIVNKIYLKDQNVSKKELLKEASWKDLNKKYTELYNEKPKQPVGYTYQDFENTYKDFVKLSKKQINKLKLIMNKYNFNLSDWEKKFLDSFRLDLWDIVKQNSGGHRDIYNVSGLNFYGKGYPDALIKPIMKDIVDKMKDVELGERDTSSKTFEEFYKEGMKRK